MELMKRLINDEAGQGLVEYALILGLIAVAVIGTMTTLGTDISNLWTKISSNLTK